MVCIEGHLADAWYAEYAGDRNMMYAVLNIIDHIKSAVKVRVEKEGKQILEVELYLDWLEGFDFVLDAVEVSDPTSR